MPNLQITIFNKKEIIKDQLFTLAEIDSLLAQSKGEEVVQCKTKITYNRQITVSNQRITDNSGSGSQSFINETSTVRNDGEQSVIKDTNFCKKEQKVVEKAKTGQESERNDGEQSVIKDTNLCKKEHQKLVEKAKTDEESELSKICNFKPRNTNMCVFFRFGKCKFGSECNFKHVKSCCSDMQEENQKLKVKIAELTTINLSQKKELYRLNGLEFCDKLNKSKVNYKNDIINLHAKKQKFNEEEFKTDIDKLAETQKGSDMEVTDASENVSFRIKHPEIVDQSNVSENVSFRVKHPEIVEQSNIELNAVKSDETNKIVKMESKAVMGKRVAGGRAFTKAELVQQRLRRQDKNLRRWNRWKENKKRERMVKNINSERV